MPCKYAYYGELVMKLAGDWLRACFEQAVAQIGAARGLSSRRPTRMFNAKEVQFLQEVQGSS